LLLCILKPSHELDADFRGRPIVRLCFTARAYLCGHHAAFFEVHGEARQKDHGAGAADTDVEAVYRKNKGYKWN
jgi:hypothetical protein